MIKRFFKNKVVYNTIILGIFTFLVELYVRFLTDNPLICFQSLRILLSSVIIAFIFSYITHFFNRKVIRVLNIIYMLAVSIFLFVEFGLYNFLGFFMGIGNAEQGTKVMSYIIDFLNATKFYYWILFVPFIIFTIYYIFFDKKVIKEENKNNYTLLQKCYIEVVTLIILCLFCGLYYWTVRDNRFQDELQSENNYALWLYPENSNLAVNNYGVLVYVFTDIKSQILGIDADYVMNLDLDSASYDGLLLTNDEDVPVDLTRTIDDSAWIMLNENTTDSATQKLNNYFMNRNITSKNDYTGIFKGKNLIIMLMESVNEISILNEEDFPTLYKLYNEGISFRNNFSPRNNCSTGNNEMTVLTSLFTINNTCTANTYYTNTYYEAAFNIFNNAGYTTSAYHDYTEYYYNRSTYLPRMGASVYYNVKDMGINYNTQIYQEWPSDLEMYKAIQDKYMNDTPFMIYVAGVTTHQSYYNSSEWGDEYMSRWADTNYPTSLKRYLSKMTVLDQALEELLNQLEEAGELENTVIALFGDHYPYGLTDDQINAYLTANGASYTVDHTSTTEHNVDRTPLIIYNSEIEGEAIYDYTTIIDLLPTLLNMFDMDYDSRLYLGTDIFSSTHVSRAYFADGSWQDENAYYYAPSSKITYFDNATKTYTNEEIKAINSEIKTRQSMSASAIKSNYFKYLGEGLEKYQQIIDEAKAQEEASSEDSSTDEESGE